MKNKNKGIVPLIAIIIIAAVVLAGGGVAYYYYATKTTKIQQTTLIEQAQDQQNNQQQNTQNQNTLNKPPKSALIEIDSQAIEKEREICSKNNDPLCYLELALMADKKEMCEAIDSNDLKKGDYKNFCLAILQKDITKCQYVDGQSGTKGLSIWCSAIVKNDKNMCNDRELQEIGIEMSDICIGWVNHYNKMSDKKFFDPVAYCQGNDYKDKNKNFYGAFLYVVKEQCYQESINMIIEFGKSSSYSGNICSILENLGDSSGRRDTCYYRVALKKKDVSICNSISDSKTKSLCIGTITVPAKVASPAEDLGKQIEEKTADWKTYNNTEMGLSFKYPKDWKIEQRNNDSLTILSPNIINPSGVLGKNDMRIGILGMNAVPSKYSNNINEWATGFIQFQSLTYGIEILKKEEFILDNEKALRVLYKPKDTRVPDGNYYTSFLGEVYVILENSKGYTINYDPYDSNLIESFEAILFTLKFTK